MSYKFLAKIVLLSIISLSSYAGEAKKQPIYKKTGELSGEVYAYKGEIKIGDAAKLAKFITANRYEINSINLDSPGGNVNEAILMGELIKAARLDTWVQPGSVCASACFFIWINGANRSAVIGEEVRNIKTGKYISSKIGLHRPYMASMTNDDNSLSNQSQLVKHVDAYLVSKGVPRRLIDLMMSRPSNDIYWITEEDYYEIGESPIELEELYISKCNDTRRKLYQQIDAARKSNNRNTEANLVEKLGNINQCIDNLNAEVRQRNISEKFQKILKSK